MEVRYNPQKIEPKIIKFWEKNHVYKKVKKRGGKKKFLFIDGPPFTSGYIHLGHSWNKAMKDMILRYKRIQGFIVNDQPGYDMHGLPIEVQVQKKFNIKNRKEILRIGIDKFTKMCRKYALEMLEAMNKEFKRLGIWQDWDNPYMSINNTYIEGSWWALKKAWENKLLYKGRKVITWCPVCATALAKHELDYKTIKENSIYIKFKTENPNEYLIIWTTTPWTIPFNMAVMVNPEIDYVKAGVGDEFWIIAKVLAEPFIQGLMNKEYKFIKEFKGDKLLGLNYEHPLSNKIPELKEYSKKKNVHTVILSKKYVDTSAGSGLVHCAPGCGPEDYEVGKKYKLPVFNDLDDDGYFGNKSGELNGLRAKDDDKKITEMLGNSVLTNVMIEHEYPHCWRSKNPVIFRASKQWFIKTSKLRNKMRAQNRKVYWIPDWAGSAWFDSWLKELDDWCISRQRYWGIPLPIWICDECGEKTLVGSWTELKKLSNLKKEIDFHRPHIDKVTFKCKKCKGLMKRVPDVLDVWLDSGSAPWSSLNFPRKKNYFKGSFPMEFIIEGKDQIRGWFNSLICLSNASWGIAPYKKIFMHGFVVDEKGKKMSKSAGNVIEPKEMVNKFGADSLRFYQIGSTSPGVDPKFNIKDLKDAHRALNVIWNTHLYALKNFKIEHYKPVMELVIKLPEDKWIINRLNQTVSETTKCMDNYFIHLVPRLIKKLLVEDFSREYLKLIKNRVLLGSKEEKKNALAIIDKVLSASIRMLSIVSPFIAEEMYLNLRNCLRFKEESVFMLSWPKARPFNKSFINGFELARSISQAILHLREKAGINKRWPLMTAYVAAKDAKLLNEFTEIIKEQANIKELKFENPMVDFSVKPDYKVLNQLFPGVVAQIIGRLTQLSQEYIKRGLLELKSVKINVESKDYVLPENAFIITEKLPNNILSERISDALSVYLDTKQGPELISEGFTREVIRRIQETRKKFGLKRNQKIKIILKCDNELKTMLKKHLDWVTKQTNSELLFNKTSADAVEYRIKGKELRINIRTV